MRGPDRVSAARRGPSDAKARPRETADVMNQEPASWGSLLLANCAVTGEAGGVAPLTAGDDAQAIAGVVGLAGEEVGVGTGRRRPRKTAGPERDTAGPNEGAFGREVASA